MAARMVTGARLYDRIIPIFDDLHWLPVSQRVVLNTALMACKCIHRVVSDLHWLPVSQRVVFNTALMACKCIHRVVSVYISLVDRTCALHPVELRFRACGLRWGSKVSPSMDRPPGTVCRLHYEHQSCTKRFRT